MQRVRFWVWGRAGWVRLTLREGEELTWGYSQRTEEGYHSRWERYWLEGGQVVREWCIGGRDCDGRLETSGADCCPVAELCGDAVTIVCHDERGRRRSRPELDGFGRPLRSPLWRCYRPAEVYDEYARAAGY